MNKFEEQIINEISEEYDFDEDINIAVFDSINKFSRLNIAKWKICCDGYYPYCSRCLHEPPSGEMSDYCPYCGANMIESKEQREEQIKRWKERI